jgi:hypothetical protein
MHSKAAQRSSSSSPVDIKADHAHSSDTRGWSFLRNFGLLLVGCLDQLLRYHLGIREFSDRADCVLRISKTRARSYEMLPNGLQIVPGDLLLELHLWNEQLGTMGRTYTVFAWGVEFLRRFRFSLTLLAAYVDMNEEWVHAKAVHACFATCLRRPDRGFRHLGFTVASANRSTGRKAHDFFEALLTHALIWAYRPCAKRSHPQNLKRMELWLSMAELRRLYGRPAIRGQQDSPNRRLPQPTRQRLQPV